MTRSLSNPTRASTHLSFQDIAADSRSAPTFVQLTLKVSKTDPFRQRIKIVLGATGDDLCPVDALFAYLRLRGDGDGPLFQRSDDSPFTRAAFIAGFRRALIQSDFLHQETSGYSGHSFRAGMASTAAAVGKEDSLIRTLGRWESLAYLIYLRLPRDNLQSYPSFKPIELLLLDMLYGIMSCGCVA